MSIKEFLGGVRVLQPLAENLRDLPPLDVFDSFPIQGQMLSCSATKKFDDCI